MKNQSVFYSLTRVVIILTAAFFFGAQADDKKGGKDPRAEKFRAAEEEIWGAVKAGKLSKKEAMSKLEVLKGQIWGDKKDWDGKKDPDIEVLKRQLEALKRENEGLRKRLEKRKDR